MCINKVSPVIESEIEGRKRKLLKFRGKKVFNLLFFFKNKKKIYRFCFYLKVVYKWKETLLTYSGDNGSERMPSR
jgi:hypothetical protein